MRDSFVLLAGLVIFAASVAAPSSAHADDLSIVAQGTIGQSCSIAVASGFNAPLLQSAGAIGATATVDCNTGFALRATSAQGAMRTTGTPNAGFTSAVAYSLNFSMPLDNGSILSASCGSGSLVAGQASCALSPAGTGLGSGGVSAIDRTAQLQVSWPAPTASLIAGTFTDAITLSISVQP